MGQILRPDSTVSSSNISSGNHLQVDEVTPNDGDKIVGTTIVNSGSTSIILGMQNPAATPGPGLSILRWRSQKSAGAGNATETLRARQGGAVIATSATAAAYPSTGFTLKTASLDLSSITDWTDLRIEWATDHENGGYIPELSWLEIEVPDPAAAPASAGNFFAVLA